MQDESAIDFNKLMHSGINNYDKVIIILTEGYKDRAEQFRGGVGKEYRYIIGNIEKNPKKFIFVSFVSLVKEILDKIVPLEFTAREIVDLYQDEKNKFQSLFAKLTDTKIYNFSDVTVGTPVIESKEIKPFTLQ